MTGYCLLLTISQFLDLYPATIEAFVAADLALRRLFCNFLSGSLLTVLARGEDNIQDQVHGSIVMYGSCLQRQLQHYLNLRKAVDDFRNHVKEQLDRLDGGAKDDLQHKFSSLLTFDFEAAARLKAWGSFNAILNVRYPYARFKGEPDDLDVQECQIYAEPKVYELLADIILSSEAPSESKLYLVNKY